MKTATATFTQVGTATFTVTRPTNGGIADTSGNQSVSCGNTDPSIDRCSTTFTKGQVTVKLQAFPNSGHTFGGFTGACAGKPNPCTLTINEATTVGATFN